MTCSDRTPIDASRRPLTIILAILALAGLSPIGIGGLQTALRSPLLRAAPIIPSPTWRRWFLSSLRDDADGGVPRGVPIFDESLPSIANLDPALRETLTLAARDAGADGVRVVINSGWRSPRRQAQLFREAVSKYGSKEAAARWVAPTDTSSHVRGDAVDIGPEEARAWLSRHGAVYGLCQTYRNEPWHYELRPAAARRGCPPPYADPTHDPRSGSRAMK